MLPVFPPYNKNSFRGTIDSNTKIQVKVHSSTEINAVWTEEIKNGSLYKAKMYDLNISKSSPDDFYESAYFYEISFLLTVTESTEQTMNLWVRNGIGESMFTFFVDVKGNF